MEADDFFSVYEALKNASRTLQLTLCDPCPINKIIWSSFDHITGPELRFIWEVVAATNLTPVALSTNSESTKDGSVSTTSSMSRDTNSAAYEDIDDILQVAEIERPQYLDEFMIESRSTLAGTTTVTDDDEDVSRLMTSFTSSPQFTEDESQSEGTSRLEGLTEDECFFKTKMLKGTSSLSSSVRLQGKADNSTSSLYKRMEPEVVDYGLDPLTGENAVSDPVQCSNSFATEQENGAVLSELNVNPTLLNKASLQPPNGEPDMSNSSACCDTDGVATLLHDDNYSGCVPQALTTSAIDSGIAGTVSAHSDLSGFCASPPLENEYCQREGDVGTSASDNLTFSKVDEGYGEFERTCYSGSYAINENVDYDTLMEMSGESTSLPPTDDEFIAKLVLTDQVYSLQLPSINLMHKVNLVPKRRLLVGSYLFPVKRAEDGKSVTCAISVVMADVNYEWYMKRQSMIEEMFVDVTSRLKASYYSEAMEDVICRMRSEFERMLSVLGVVEQHPICSSLEEIKIRQTHLYDSKLHENTFLAKAITGLLRSQSHCVIVGDECKMVLKILNTLCLFVPEEWRWCCLKGYKYTYSPYLRLQAISRNELPVVITAGVESHWPIAVIDVDKQLVCVSSNYLKHRKVKQLRQRNDIAGILLSAGMDVEIGDVRQNKLELRNCHASNVVIDFLAKMDFLPFERNARLGFIRQFLLSVENHARAFITYVQDASKPSPTDKTNAISSKWSLSAARRALDLISESSFSIVLAEAERLKTGFADFICDTRSL